MATLTVQISDKDKALFIQLIKRLDAKIIKTSDMEDHVPNAITVKAIEDARNGKTKRIEDLDAFFSGL